MNEINCQQLHVAES